MYILFFLVHIFFAYLLFLLDAYFEAWAFILLWITSLIFFSPFRFSRSHSDIETNHIENTETSLKNSIQDGVVSFFSKQALFLSIITTNIALLGIIYSGESFTWIQISTFISSYIILISFFWIWVIYKKFFQIPLLSQISEIHIPVLSCLLFLWYYFQGETLDVWYSISFLSSAVFFTYFLKKTELSFVKKQLYGIFIWFFLYITSIIWFIFLFGNIAWEWITTLLFIYSVVLFEWVSFAWYKTFRESVRAVSLLWLFISTISYFFLLFQNSSYWIVLFLLLSLIFNIYIHARFENYPSLIFSTIIPVPLYYFFFGFSETFGGFLLSLVCIGLGITFFWRIIRTPYKWDEYVFQSVAVLVFIGNTLSFGWRIWIHWILEYSVILLLFSILTFVSYLQIRK